MQGSSDEEDLVLDNMPDDDEYDTDDSFIDDTELVGTVLSSSSLIFDFSMQLYFLFPQNIDTQVVSLL